MIDFPHNLLNVRWRHPVIKASKSFGLLDGGNQFIKSSVIKK